MDLALEMGVPYERLAEEMTEREFRQWVKYAKTKGLPARRNEVYMAQVSWVLARVMGGNDSAKLEDFMFDFEDESQEGEVDLEAAKEAFGFAPRARNIDGR